MDQKEGFSMRRIQFHLDSYENSNQAIRDIARLMGFDPVFMKSTHDLEIEMEKIDQDILVEISQHHLVKEDLVQVVDALERVQQKNDHLYLIRSVD